MAAPFRRGGHRTDLPWRVITISPRGDHADPSFDRYARLVRRTLDVPVGLVSLVEATRQVFVGADGLPDPYQQTRETPLSHSFCQYVVSDRAPLVISDARGDARLGDNLAIPDLGVVAYAGWPLTDHEGRTIGSLCAIDTVPREWTATELANLADLAAVCSAELAQRELTRASQQDFRQVERLHQRSRVLLGLIQGLADTRSLPEIARAVHRVGVAQLGCVRGGIWLRNPLVADTSDALGEYVEKLELLPSDEAVWEAAMPYSLLATDQSTPVGVAFTRRRPLYYPDRAAQDAEFVGRHVATASGEARAVVPLSSSGVLLGVLALFWPDEQEFGAEMRATIGSMAAYTAAAVARSALLSERIEVAATLQQAMLSPLPRAERITMAARYRPASAHEHVGGDWFDAIPLPSGGTALAIGDVVGHDIRAAAMMGQLRSMLRTMAWAVDGAPSLTLARLDQAMDGLEVDTLATALLVRVDPPAPGVCDHRVRWSNAGHPPPLLIAPDGRATWLDSVGDLMLGVLPEWSRTDGEIAVAPGSTLVLVTDGLVEGRQLTLDAGLAAVAASVVLHHRLPVDDLVDALLGDVLPGALQDDVAVLVVRFEG